MRIACLTSTSRFFLPDGYWRSPGGEYNLTFDDGPFPETTPRLLDLLGEFNVLATFFFTGENCERYPELVSLTAEAGHEIGNHSSSHRPFPLMSAKTIESEIDKTNELIFDLTGKAPASFRPPYGIIDGRAAKALRERSMTPVYWGTLAEDWLPQGAQRVASRTIRQLKGDTLIVLHEGRSLSDQCTGATEILLEHARDQGLTFDTVAGSLASQK